jgi:hypothetical protein
MADWVLAVERAYVAAATTRGFRTPRVEDASQLPKARAAAGAIASRYLAVGTPRTLGLVAGDATIEEAALSVAAHRTWFQPREIRCAISQQLAKGVDGVVASLAETLACDIVCVHTKIDLRAAQLRRGTHVNVLAAATIDDELRSLAAISEEARDLGALAAGLKDGRQLDEITVFVAGELAIALAALR